MVQFNPHPILLSKNPDPGLEVLLKKYSDGLGNSVNFGTQVLAWDIQERTGGIEHFPVWMLFRHILELLDSVTILIEKSSIDPCKPLLRAALESTLNLEYMLDRDFEKRAKSFVLCNYFERHNNNVKLLKGTPENKRFYTTISKDKTSPHIYSQIDQTLLQEQLGEINEVIQHEEYREIREEFFTFKKTRKKEPKWYQLFHGPDNLEQLASNLHRNGLYEVFYRDWSGPTHGTDVLNHWVLDENEKLEIIELRYGKNAQEITLNAATLFTILFEVIRRTRIQNHEDEFKTWFNYFIPFFNGLLSGKQINIKL